MTDWPNFLITVVPIGVCCVLECECVNSDLETHLYHIPGHLVSAVIGKGKDMMTMKEAKTADFINSEWEIMLHWPWSLFI